MGKVTGFMELDRVERDYEPVEDRIKPVSYTHLTLPTKA